MNTAQDRMKFAVKFAGMELDAISRGDWLNLRDSLLQFLGWGKHGTNLDAMAGILCMPLRGNTPGEMSEEDIRTLQQRVQKLINEIVWERVEAIPGQHSGVTKGVMASIKPDWEYE